MAMTSAGRLHSLNEDVLNAILEQVATLTSVPNVRNYTLKRLSTTSKRIRSACMPILFRTCRVRTAHLGVPPEAIRTYVRHLQYSWAYYSIDQLRACGYYEVALVPPFDYCDTSAPPPEFGWHLDYFPALRSVVFLRAAGGVPWSALMKCMAHPTITSISLGAGAMWRCAPLPTPSDLPLRTCRLTHFSYLLAQWRVNENEGQGVSLQPTYAQERSYLRAIVLAMSATAESLALPVETAPLLEMAELDWPRMHTLMLAGRYTDPKQCHSIARLLPRMPNLRSLTTRAMQLPNIPRPLLLRAPLETSYCLRSLTLSYPNPNDPIFSCLGDGLRSLSLRDGPRHYFRRRYSPDEVPTAYPILSASECLATLKRISAPLLSVLELVYEVDDAEDDLLQHLSRAFPLLQELELHRYRTSPDDEVPYLQIVERLMAIKYLRALYLNVDIEDPIFNQWTPTRNNGAGRELTRDERGKELIRLFRESECFEYLALPVHVQHGASWVLYYPEWRRGPAIERYSQYALDSRALIIHEPLSYR